jgi:nucleotide-binding universal stress UspA family protein
MLSQTLPIERVSLGRAPRRSTTADSSRTMRERALRVDATGETSMQPTIKRLLVTLSQSEPHHDVAIRAQLLANEASVRSAVVLTRPLSESQRVFQQIPLPGLTRLTGPDIDRSLRLLHASSSADRISVETRERPADVLRLAKESDLVLVGRRRTLPGLLAPLGADARRLLRRTRTPLLVVGGKPKGPYRRVLVATDLETDITSTLAWAGRIAPQGAVILLHVYRGLFEGKLQWAGVPDEQIMSHRLAAQHEAALGMTALLKQHDSTTISRALLAHGLAVSDVVRKAGELDADLILVVRSNHSWWIEALGASVSFEIATRADRDVLVVHEPTSMAPSISADGVK